MAAGGDVLALPADVSQARDIERFIGAAIDRWHRLDGIVHNAGKSAAGLVESSTDATWEADLQLKLMGAVRLARLATPHLRESKGSVLFTLALAAKAPGCGQHPELGIAGRRHGPHEGAVQGAGPRRYPGQRHPHRAD